MKPPLSSFLRVAAEWSQMQYSPSSSADGHCHRGQSPQFSGLSEELRVLFRHASMWASPHLFTHQTVCRSLSIESCAWRPMCEVVNCALAPERDRPACRAPATHHHHGDAREESWEIRVSKGCPSQARARGSGAGCPV